VNILHQYEIRPGYNDWYPCRLFGMFPHQTSSQGLHVVTEVFVVFISPETFRDCYPQLTTRLLPSTSFARYCFSPLPSVDTSNWVEKNVLFIGTGVYLPGDKTVKG